MEYVVSGRKKITSIYDRLALEINRCLQGAHVPEWWTKGKTTLKCPKQLQTHKLPININIKTLSA